jgi:isopenicillin N synthase-like dioxygenase
VGLPLVDVAPLVTGSGSRRACAGEIGAACREAGFFYVSGHGVGGDLVARLERLSRAFFAQDLATKMTVAMARGGPAWRGYFPVGGELTSGRPDGKEGLYFGIELPPDDPAVLAERPLHGPNLFPPDPPEFRATVLEYTAALTRLGDALMEGIALSLGLEADYFARALGPPLTLFRIFNYPPEGDGEGWGVAEHTDYGVLTILGQDDAGGLQVDTPTGWVDAPPLAGTFVCNIGDMLDRMTAGLYRSTPHRVRNRSSRDRLAYPFFYDPNWDASVGPIAGIAPAGDRPQRWDDADVHAFFGGTYGDYLLGKVGKVFPALREAVLDDTPAR